MKKVKNIKVIVAAVASAVVVGGGIFYWQQTRINDMEVSYTKIIEEKDSVLNMYTANTIQGYVASRKISAGEILSKADFDFMTLPLITSPENVVSDLESLVGKTIKISVDPRTAMTKDMVYDPKKLTDDLRKYEYGYVRLPILIQKTDILEMQIVFPNGVKQTIIPKFKLTALDTINNLIFMNAGYEEDALMNAAFVDMVMWGAEVRAIQYVDGEIQKETLSTYTPNEAVVKLLRNNPQLVETAKAKYAAGLSVRTMLEEELSKYWIEEDTARFNVDMPSGSYVSKLVGSGIGSIIVTTPESNTQPENGTEEVPNSTIEFNNEEVIPSQEESVTAPPSVSDNEDIVDDAVIDQDPVDPEASGIGE